MKEPVWIDIQASVSVNDLLTEEYGGHPGVRDEAALRAALTRPQQLNSYGEPDLFDLAAAYGVGIIRKLPFLDGNKRTGFVLSVLFLERNGVVLDVPEADAARTVWDLADKKIPEDAYAAWLRERCGG